MDAVTQQLMQQLSGQAVTQISQRIGADPQTTNAALSVALPLLMSALANNASKPAGAQALHQALSQDHNGAVLNDLNGFLSNPEAANGAGILGHVLGAQQPVVTKGLTQATGLNSDQIAQILQVAAPLVMGMLGKNLQQQGYTPQGLSSYLGNQQQQAQQASPDVMGVLNTLLDTNKDGSGLDEAIGLVGKLFGGK